MCVSEKGSALAEGAGSRVAKGNKLEGNVLGTANLKDGREDRKVTGCGGSEGEAGKRKAWKNIIGVGGLEEAR